MSTTLTGKNQITIPAAIVKEMNLEPGAQIEWTIGDTPGVIILRVRPSIRERLAEVQQWGAAIKARMGPDWDPIAELVEEREKDMMIEEAEQRELADRLEGRK